MPSARRYKPIRGIKTSSQPQEGVTPGHEEQECQKPEAVASGEDAENAGERQQQREKKREPVGAVNTEGFPHVSVHQLLRPAESLPGGEVRIVRLDEIGEPVAVERNKHGARDGRREDGDAHHGSRRSRRPGKAQDDRESHERCRDRPNRVYEQQADEQPGEG